MTSMAFDNRITYGKPQAASFLFGGKVRIEYFIYLTFPSILYTTFLQQTRVNLPEDVFLLFAEHDRFHEFVS